ncbi:HAD family hydrolase [Derxia gummosa]|uniref:HAD family hydrolase n=1 Tax=Derxia gummosa DSM 723 TaxID=1121388 RepID=A0A8B6XBA8_9BURK|nr:HAD family hydrolase [Derxia gummosa]
MIRGILIDLDDTLADDRLATEKAIAALWQSRAPERDASNLSLRWLSITDKHWRRFRSGETTLQGQRRNRLAELFDQKFTEAQADQLFDEYLYHYERSWTLVAGATEFLAATARLPKVIVTNSEAKQAARKVALLSIGSHFIGLVTPEVAGAPKPNPQIFRYALQVLGLPASDCMMIGDSHEHDIQPAQALGLATFHVGNAPGCGLAEAARAIQPFHQEGPTTAGLS